MKNSVTPSAFNYTDLMERIGLILQQARKYAYRQISRIQVIANWEIGRAIVEFEQKGQERAAYGEKLIIRLAKDMTARFGKGFSKSNLFLMRQFYLTYPEKFQTASGISAGSLPDVKDKTALSTERNNLSTVNTAISTEVLLSWSHYCELLKVEEPLARSFYEREAVNNNWSVRELKRQINAMLFERLALSKNSEQVIRLAQEGQIIERPEDAFKDPYILEFLNLKEEAAYSESELEQALIDKLQEFLLELGKGFTFVARQKRITVSNRHYHIDLVFYNRFLRCFVLIDLKTGELDHADIGQMNFYLNYFRENEKTADENDPVGLVLCAKKDEVFAKYILGGINNKLFVSRYKLALPSEEELTAKLQSLPLWDKIKTRKKQNR